MPSLDDFLQFLDVKSKGRREFEVETDSTTAAGPSSKSNPYAPGRTNLKGPGSKGDRFRPYEKERPHRVGVLQDSANPFSRRNEGSSGYSKNQQGPTACIMPQCGLVHYLGQCTLFRDKTLQQRMDIVARHKLCRCCMLTGHMAVQCPRDGCSKCPDARPKHHFRMCPKTTFPSQPFKEAGGRPNGPNPQ